MSRGGSKKAAKPAKGTAKQASKAAASPLGHAHHGIPDLTFHDPHITYPEKDVRSIGVVAFSGNMAAAMDILNRWAEENPRIKVYINNYLKPFAGGRLLERIQRTTR